MSDIVEQLRKLWFAQNPKLTWDDMEAITEEAAEEIRRLRKYEQLVQFIANDYYELSHDKVKWQHNDWCKRCRKLIQEDSDQI